MNLRTFTFCLTALVYHNASSQNLPEQDCIGAIPLCQNVYSTTNSYTGPGANNNEINNQLSCLTSGEKNCVWYTFTVQTSGNVSFTITPNIPSDDYDWAVFNLSNHPCDSIFTNASLEVSCNYAANIGCGGVTGPNGNTGGPCGIQNEPVFAVSAGQRFVVNVSNYSSSQGGYTIDFSASTAIIYDIFPPAPPVSGMGCTDSSFVLTFYELIDCSTIAADGSDFYLLDPLGNIYPASGAIGIGCSANQPYVTQVQVFFPGPVGNVYGMLLKAKNGVDANTISDLCGNFVVVDDTIGFINIYNDATVNIGPDLQICPDDSHPLLSAALPGVISWNWALNGNAVSFSPSFTPSASGIYSVTISYGNNCNASDTMVLSYLAAPSVLLGNDISICPYDSLPLLNATTAGAISYQWFLNGNTLANSNAVLQTTQAGNYSVTVTVSASTCTGSDTLQLFISQPVVLALNDEILCEGDSAMLDAGVNVPSYLWIHNGSPAGNSQMIYITDSGSYIIMVTDSNQCSYSDTAMVALVEIAGTPVVKCPLINGNEIIFSWDSVSNASGYQVSFNGGATWQQPSSGVNGLTHTAAVSSGNITVQALSAFGCKAGSPSSPPDCGILIPNIVTPNGDLKNDTFFISNLYQYPMSGLQIFNRWGREIFQTSDYHNDWSGIDLPDGTYYFFLRLGSGKAVSGTVTLTR